MEAKPNPELYERMRVPFETEDEARASVEAFMEKVGQLREQYKMPDVMLNVLVTVKDGNGEVINLRSLCTWGDDGKSLMMAKTQFDQLFENLRGVLMAAGFAAQG